MRPTGGGGDGWRRVVTTLALLASAHGCAVGVRPMASLPELAATHPCRVAVPTEGAAPVHLAWVGPSSANDRRHLDAWCAASGAPVVVTPPGAARAARPLAADGLVVVSWNVHEGAGDVRGLIARLRAGALTDGAPATRFVLLLQEARRAGGAPPRSDASADIVADAGAAGLSIYYVASKRIGPGTMPAPDRGNAILSTEPLSHFRAIELPFERQRRLAVEAVVSGVDAAGTPWRLRLVSAHFESTASIGRWRVLASVPRQRQARALVDAIPADEPVVLGGDFNTWFGFSDATYRALAAAIPDISLRDRRRTFGRLFRLDHLFARPPDGWRASARRLDTRLGSDHYPLLAQVVPAGPPAP